MSKERQYQISLTLSEIRAIEGMIDETVISFSGCERSVGEKRFLKAVDSVQTKLFKAKKAQGHAQ